MKKFHIKQQTVIGELKINELIKYFSHNKKLHEFKRTPFLTLKKDFSFIISSSVEVGDLVRAIKSSNNAIGEVIVFDVYNNIEKNDGMISVGVEVEILQQYKVFNAKEINEIMHSVILKAKKEVKAQLRV